MSIFDREFGDFGKIVTLPTKVSSKTGLPGQAKAKANSDHQHELDLTGVLANGRAIAVNLPALSGIFGVTNTVSIVGQVMVGTSASLSFLLGDRIYINGQADMLALIAGGFTIIQLRVGGAVLSQSIFSGGAVNERYSIPVSTGPYTIPASGNYTVDITFGSTVAGVSQIINTSSISYRTEVTL